MNNSNICPIIYSNPNNVSNKINPSLDFYKKESTNHVLKHLPIAITASRKSGNRKIKKVISYILKNEDLFSNIMTSIMLADMTHDKSKSSLNYWRSKNCLWTLNRTIYKNKNRPLSLSNDDVEDRSSRGSIGGINDTLAVLYETPVDEVLMKEEFLLQAKRIEELSEREKGILTAYYDNNLNEKEIGKKFGITQQRVSKIIIGIKKKINYE